MANKRTDREIAYAATNAAHRVQHRALNALDLLGASDETMAEQRSVVAALDAQLDSHEVALDLSTAEGRYDNDPLCICETVGDEPTKPKPEMSDAEFDHAIAWGQQAAGKYFADRHPSARRVEVHINRDELAVALAAAYQAGRDSKGA